MTARAPIVPKAAQRRFDRFSRALRSEMNFISTKGHLDPIRREIAHAVSVLERNGFGVWYQLRVKSKLFPGEYGPEWPVLIGMIGRLETGKITAPGADHSKPICFYSESDLLSSQAPCPRCHDIHYIDPIFIRAPQIYLPPQVTRTIDTLELKLAEKIDHLISIGVFRRIIRLLKKTEAQTSGALDFGCRVEFQGLLEKGLRSGSPVRSRMVAGLSARSRFTLLEGKARDVNSLEELGRLTRRKTSIRLETARAICRYCGGRGHSPRD